MQILLYQKSDVCLQTDQTIFANRRSTSRNTSQSRHSNSTSSSGSRSRFIGSGKLIKSNLFQTINARKGSGTESVQDKNLQIKLLQDALQISAREEQRILAEMRNSFRIDRQECRRAMRALEHLAL